MERASEVRDEIRAKSRELRQVIPDVYRAFAELNRASMGDGELPAVTKEMAALAIAIVKECDGCISAHLHGLIRLGATRKQVAELIGVAIMMDGGPATVWGPRALAAYDELVDDATHGAQP
jgi:AhpD family alkylhydroperoxidase